MIAVYCAAYGAYAQQTRVLVQGDDLSPDLSRDLTEELDTETVAETQFEARRQARRAASKLEQYLNSRGYFAASVSPSVEPGPPITGIVTVDPGKRFRIGVIDIAYEGGDITSEEAAYFRSILTLSSGDLAEPRRVINQEQMLLSAMKEQGYAFAEAAERIVIGDEDLATIDITYRIQPGARVRFGEVTFTGTRLRRSYAERLIPFQTREAYTPDLLEEFNRRLGETRLYSVFTARLDKEPANTADDGSAIHDVTVSLVERDRFTIASGASFSTNEGPGLTVEWTRRNVTRRGDRIRLTSVLAEQQRSLSGEWSFPNALGYGRSLRFNGFGGFDETDAFDRTSVIFGSTLDIKRSPNITYAYGVASEFSRETDTLGERDLWILSASGALQLDYSNNLLDPSDGWRAELRAEPGTAVGDDESNFISVLSAASFYQNLDEDDRWVGAIRGRLGSVYGAEALELPTSRRFFAGGGGSTRGFAFQSIGPKDDDGRPTGGRGLLETSAELRWRQSETLGFAAFIDGASVTSRDVPTFDNMRFGAGFGVRYFTAIGPLRFDLATPLSRDAGDDPLQIYISIGQAF